MKRVQNRAQLTAVLLIISVGGQTAYAWSPFESVGEGYKKIKLWTNDLGELYDGGFESNCPKIKNLKPYSKANPLGAACEKPTLDAKDFSKLGIVAEQAEEWFWVTEALPLQEKALLGNHRYLGKLLGGVLRNKDFSDPKALKDSEFAQVSAEVQSIEENLVLLGEVERALNLVQQKRMKSPMFSRSSISKMKEEAQAYLDNLSAEEQQLTQAKIEILKQHPFLSHHVFKGTINYIKEGSALGKYEMGRPEFYKSLETALRDNQAMIDDRIQKIGQIKQNEKEIGEFLSRSPEQSEKYEKDKERLKKSVEESVQDPHLLHELIASVDLGRLPEYEGLYSAQCRLENRVLKDMGMEYIRGLGVNALLVAGSLGSSTILMAGNSVSKAALVLRAAPMVAVNAAGLALDVGMLADTKKRCEALRTSAMLKANDLETGMSAGVAYAECKDMYAAQKIMTLLGNVASFGIDGRAIMKVRADRLAQVGKRIPKSVTQALDVAKHGSSHSAAELAENSSPFVKDNFVTTSQRVKPSELADQLRGKEVRIAVSDGAKESSKAKVQLINGEMQGLTPDGKYYVVKDSGTGDLVRVPVKEKGRSPLIAAKALPEVSDLSVAGRMKTFKKNVSAALASGDMNSQRREVGKMRAYLADEIDYRTRLIKEYSGDALLKSIEGQTARDTLKHLDGEVSALTKQLDDVQAIDYYSNAIDKLKTAAKADSAVARAIKDTGKSADAFKVETNNLEVPDAKQQEVFDAYYGLDQKGKLSGKLNDFKRNAQNFFDVTLKRVDPELQAYIKKTFPGEEAYAYQINRELRKRGMSSDDIFKKFQAIACECRGGGHCKL